MPDRYAYPGSDVLINKYGITDYDDWKEAETDFIGARMFHLSEHPLDGGYDLAHLQVIHAYLTQDLYVWGGEIRDTDTHPGGTGIAHCRPPFIVPEAERVFRELAASDHLRGLDADAFSDGLAWVWGETTAIHPFRDVNTRSQHIMFNQLARDAGWIIDWSQIPGDVFAHARTLAIVEDHTGIDALIRPNLYRLDPGGRPGAALPVEQVRSFQARGISRTPDVLGRELDAARRRRRPHPAGESFGTEKRRPEPPTPHGGLSL